MNSTQRFTGFLKSKRFFTLYFGLGIPPALFGSVGVAYRLGLTAGLVMSVITAAWLIETFVTTCSRCAFYGTTNCGLPGMVAPLIVKKRSPFSITKRRVQIHAALDVAMIMVVNIVYALALPAVWPVIAICSIGGWIAVFRRRRFHGLLFRLKPQTHEPHGSATTSVVSAPVSVSITPRPTRNPVDQ
jgi:hypothetical protein